jgi:hypothetical protein
VTKLTKEDRKRIINLIPANQPILLSDLITMSGKGTIAIVNRLVREGVVKRTRVVEMRSNLGPHTYIELIK